MQFSYENSLWGETWQLKVQHVTAAIIAIVLLNILNLLKYLLSKLWVENNFGKCRRLILQPPKILFFDYVDNNSMSYNDSEMYFYFIFVDG